MQTPNKKRHAGYTMVELIMAIAIGAIVLVGLISFVITTTQEITLTRSKGNMYAQTTDLIMELNRLRSVYPNNKIVSDYATVNGVGFDAMVLYNSGATEGALVGVVSKFGTGSNSVFLDPAALGAVYGDKVIGVHRLTATQLASTLTGSANAFLVPFYTDELFADLHPQRLQFKLFQSGSLVQMGASLYQIYHEDFFGTTTQSTTNKNIFSFTLFF